MFNWISMVALATSLSVAGYYLYQYDSRGKQIVALTHQVGTLKNDLKVAKENHAQLKNTIAALETRTAALNKTLEENCAILAEIEKDAAENEKPENKDKPVDIMGKVLDALGRKKQE